MAPPRRVVNGGPSQSEWVLASLVVGLGKATRRSHHHAGPPGAGVFSVSFEQQWERTPGTSPHLVCLRREPLSRAHTRGRASKTSWGSKGPPARLARRSPPGRACVLFLLLLASSSSRLRQDCKGKCRRSLTAPYCDLMRLQAPEGRAEARSRSEGELTGMLPVKEMDRCGWYHGTVLLLSPSSWT